MLNRWKSFLCAVLIAVSAPASAMFDEIAKKFLREPDTPERVELRANAPDAWIEIATDLQGNKYSTNPSRFKEHTLKGVFVGWIKTTQSKAAPVFTNKPKPVFFSSISRFDFDCINEQYRVLSSVFYDSRGASVFDSTAQGEWLTATPDSVGETYVRAACALAVRHGFL